MAYERISKRSSGNSHIHKKDSRWTTPAMPVQAKSVSASPQEQELPSYTPLPADWATNNNLMRSLSGAGVVQRQEESGKEELEPIQAKLTIGQPGDQYEQEADQTAQRVVNQINAPAPYQSSQAETLQREEMPEEEELQMKPASGIIQREEMPEEEELQMKPASGIIQREEMPEEEELQMKSEVQRKSDESGMDATPDLEASIQQAKGSGQPLADNIRKPMEQAFGADFSGVNIHTDAHSDQLNQSIQAKAFTTGQDVFFRQGAYEPGSRGGQELIAHELTHVVQQNGGAVQRKSHSDEENTEETRQGVASKQVAAATPDAQLKEKKPNTLHQDNSVTPNIAQRKFDPSLGINKVEHLSSKYPEAMQGLTFKRKREIFEALNNAPKVYTAGEIANAILALKEPKTTSTQDATPAAQPEQEAEPAKKEEVVSAVDKVCDTAHVAAIETVQQHVEEREKTAAVPSNVAVPPEEVAAPPEEVGTDKLIINYVWIGDAALDQVAKFNVYSWKTLGHTVKIYTQRLDGKAANASDLGIEEGDAEVIDLTSHLGIDAGSVTVGSTKELMGGGRDLIQAWITSAKDKVSRGKKLTTEHRFNMVDMTKSYIGGTQRGIVLDMKVGPSEHLEKYSESFREKFISYSRGGKSTAKVENQSMGTMQETDELRKIYATRFKSGLEDSWRLGSGKQQWIDNPDQRFFSTLTSIHGRAFGFSRGALGNKGMDVATEGPGGAVGEPGALGKGPFRVFKAAKDQTWEEGSKSATRPSEVKKLAQEVVEKQFVGERVKSEGMKEKARAASAIIPENMYVVGW